MLNSPSLCCYIYMYYFTIVSSYMASSGHDATLWLFRSLSSPSAPLILHANRRIRSLRVLPLRLRDTARAVTFLCCLAPFASGFCATLEMVVSSLFLVLAPMVFGAWNRQGRRTLDRPSRLMSAHRMCRPFCSCSECARHPGGWTC